MYKSLSFSVEPMGDVPDTIANLLTSAFLAYISQHWLDCGTRVITIDISDPAVSQNLGEFGSK